MKKNNKSYYHYYNYSFTYHIIMHSNIRINQFSTGFLNEIMYDYYYDSNIIKSKNKNNIILIYLFDIILVVNVYDTQIIYKILHKTILFKCRENVII